MAQTYEDHSHDHRDGQTAKSEGCCGGPLNDLDAIARARGYVPPVVSAPDPVGDDHSEGSGAVSTRPAQNISKGERAGRIVVGAALALLGIVVAVEGQAFWGWLGALLAVGAGGDLIVTGVRGYCPLYARLGRRPRSLQGTAR